MMDGGVGRGEWEPSVPQKVDKEYPRPWSGTCGSDDPFHNSYIYSGVYRAVESGLLDKEDTRVFPNFELPILIIL